MKTSIKLLLFLVFFAGATQSASAQIYVNIRPPVPVVVKTTQPKPNYVWVEEEWEPNGNDYRYVGGHWVAPPQPNYVYRQGYWKKGHKNKGQRWVAGKWRKNK